VWFVFPQLTGLGRSSSARFYGISSLDEARAYLAHSLLGPRLDLCTRIVLTSQSSSLHAIFGSPDDLKFRSQPTIRTIRFARLSTAGAAGSPTSKRWRLSVLADELIDAGQSLPDRTVSPEIEIRPWLPQVRLRRLQIDPSPRRHDYTPE
jgi:hypothetical protein